MAGSNDVSELHSRGFWIFGDVEGLEGAGDCETDRREDAENAGDDAENAGDWEVNEADACAFSVPAPAVFGTAKVNDDCLSDRFSFCRRERRSRRFSFSDTACSFLASSAATLSSN